MSSFYRRTKNPKTGEWENALWLDDCFGHRRYGVIFPTDRAKFGVNDLRLIAYSPESLQSEMPDGSRSDDS